MKQLPVVLLCLLLCGCARQVSAPLPEVLPETQTVPAVAGIYTPEHPLEAAYPGLIRAYPLPLRKVQGVRTIENDVLILSGYGSTTLTLFTGNDLQKAASLTLEFQLRQEDPSLQIHGNNISYFDPLTKQTVVLDQKLREIRRITLPDGLSGKPILSPDENILYYCTGWSVVAWDLESGIRRTVKEFAYEAQELTALHWEGKILECTIRHNESVSKLFLSVDQGQEMGSLPGNALLYTGNSRYFTVLPSGYQTLLIFGNSGSSPELLLPDMVGQQQLYLPEDHAAVTVCASDHGTQLDYYELSTGILRSSLTLDAPQTPKSIANSKGHSIYILAYDPDSDCDILYRWDVLRQAPDPGNTETYKAAFYTIDEPDLEGLEACREYARNIGKKYGITVHIWEDALTVQPWDYQFTAEHLVPVLQKELTLLDQRLAQYPNGVLQKTTDHFTKLSICLVRQITGSGEKSSLNTATGIQFYESNEAFVVITTGKHSEQALYHELYHVMETHILTESTALDQWESLNPAGFVYGNDQPDGDIYLQGQTRAFVDRYSMISPKEDRARVLENAMLQEKEELFRTEYMQRKLKAICTGIREAYGLKDSMEILPWEQYLINPLTPAK